LETIEWSKSEPKHSSYASRIRVFSLIPLTMIASSIVFGSVGLTIWLFVGGKLVGAEMIFPWRALMLVAVGAGGAFLLEGFVEVVFSWVCIITKLSCNLLLMPCSKLFDV
jgi:hypothetical protein